MNIVVVGQFGVESFGVHISDTLTNMGHNIIERVEFNVENKKGNRSKKSILSKLSNTFNEKMRFSNKHNREKVMKRIIKAVCSCKCDLVICTKDYFLDYEIQYIKVNTGAKVVMWFPDHIITFGRATFLNAGYDCLFFKDPYIVKELRNIYKKNAVYLPECYNPNLHPLVDYNEEDKATYECDISMIGNLHSFRVSLMEQLVDYDLRIYGTANPWWLSVDRIKSKYTGKYLAYTEKSKAIKYSKINLNTLFIGEVEGSNVRTFEIAGMKGFQILQNKPGISDLFEIDKEVVVYETSDELKDKIDYYLKHEDERTQIAKASYERAFSDHTYEKRLYRMLNFTFGSGFSEEDYFDYRQYSNGYEF